MSEIQKETYEQKTTTQEDDFDAILAMQAKSAAQRMIRQELEENPSQEATAWNLNEQPSKDNSTRNRIIAAGVGVAVLGGVAAGVNEALAPPTFSEESTTYTVQPGDGLESVVDSIPGIESADSRDVQHYVSVDPANIDALKDGLQPGENIVVPVSINGVEPTEEK